MLRSGIQDPRARVLSGFEGFEALERIACFRLHRVFDAVGVEEEGAISLQRWRKALSRS